MNNSRPRLPWVKTIIFQTLIALLIAGCGSTRYQDEALQTNVVAPASLPQLQGPPLKVDEMRFQGRHSYALKRSSVPQRSSTSIGHVVPQHTVYGQIMFRPGGLTEYLPSGDSKDLPEFGMYAGGTVNLENPRKSYHGQDLFLIKNSGHISSFRFGFGSRGQFHQSQDLTVGLTQEIEINVQSASAQIKRRAKTEEFDFGSQLFEDPELLDEQQSPILVNDRVYDFSGHYRIALYAQYHLFKFLSIDLGLSTQYLQFTPLIATNECTFGFNPVYILGCDSENNYPITEGYLNFSTYGGFTVLLDKFHISTLFTYAAAPFEDFTLPAPITFTTQGGITF